MWVPKYLILHHTASPQPIEDIMALKHYHIVLDERERYFRWEVGRDQESPSNFAAWHHNSDTFHIAVCGNYNELKPGKQLLSCIVQIATVKLHRWHLTSERFLGHCELAQRQAEPYMTECPGRNLKLALPNLRRRIDAYPVRYYPPRDE